LQRALAGASRQRIVLRREVVEADRPMGAALAGFSTARYGSTGAMMFVGGIAAGASDTVASEIGKAFGGTPRTFPTFRAVPPGTPGAVSSLGTIAGVVSATLMALPAALAWLITMDRIVVVVAACTIGAFIESALATRFERAGVLGNNTLNLLNTAGAAAVAVWWVAR
jgi:uncharacterized protein (TIGR00297 family)